jgi:hypothetical protein
MWGGTTMDDGKKHAWIARVLGIELAGQTSGIPEPPPPPPPPGTAKRPAPLLPIWIDASQRVNEAIEALRQALLADGDPDLRDIAELGLNDILDTETEPVVAALRGVDAAPRSAKARAAANKAAAQFRAYLSGDEVVALIEDNPLKVQVPLRRILVSALDTISTRLAA